MKHLKYLLLLILFTTTACASLQAGGGPTGEPTNQSNNSESSLANTQWQLVSFGAPDAETPVITGSSITLEFDGNGQVGGSGGCNSYGGRYEVQGDRISIQEIVSTLMACADQQVQDQEQRYFEALQSATRFEIGGDQLTIWYADGQSSLNFVKATSN